MIFFMLAVLIVFIAIGMPIAFSVGVTSFVYLILEHIPLSMVSQRMVSGVNSFTILTIPFFFLAGELMNSSGITDKIVGLAKAMVGHIAGGLGQVNIVASVIFAGISGSATADTAALGSILIPAMKKEGYDADFSAAITAASSVIGPIIPPSMGLVLYGVLANQPIGRMLIAGILPGFVIAGTQMVFTYFYAKKKRYPVCPKPSLSEAGHALKEGVPAIIMPIIIVGGIMSGIFTPTESAAVAVLYGFILGFFFYKKFDLKGVWDIISTVALKTIRILIIIAFSSVFSWIVTRAQVPNMVLNAILSITSNPNLIILLIIAFLLFIGLFMIPSASLVILVPILVPVAVKLGMSPIHFGILFVFTTIIGSVTPPVGICLSLAADIADIPFHQLVKAMVPFYIPLFIAVLLIAYIPWISLLIPKIFFG